MTQAAIIIGVIAFSSSILAIIVVFLNTPSAGIVCAIVLVVIVYKSKTTSGTGLKILLLELQGLWLEEVM